VYNLVVLHKIRGHRGVNEFRFLTADQIVHITQKKITLSLLILLFMYMFM